MQKKVYIIMLVLCMLLQTGCKASPALEHIVYNQEDSQEESSIDSLLDNTKNSENTNDEIFSLEERDDAEKTRDWDNEIAEQGEESTSDEAAADMEYDETTSDDYGNNQTYSDEKKDSEGGESDDSQSSQSGSSSAGDSGISENSQSGAGSFSDDAKKQVVTSDGTYIEVPENVDRVSAVGEAAILVTMLGGNGRLAATSESFTAGQLGNTVFGNNEAEVLWSDSGETQISEEAFARLLAESPDVCFETSGEMTFSEDQISRLEAAGITYVSLPSMATADGIQDSVSLIGQILGDKSEEGGVNALAKSEAYITWYKKLMAELGERVTPYSANGVDYNNDGSDKVKYLATSAENGVNSLFISDWDDSASYSLYNSSSLVLSVKGVAVTSKGYTDSPLSYFMSLAGVNNMAASVASGLNCEKVYINTFNSVSHRQVIDGSLSYNDSNKNRMSQGLGGDNYKAIIVNNNDIAAKVRSSSLWKSYGEASNGMYSYYGFLDSQNQIVRSTISGDYDIYVNPSGIGSWTGGSAESPLEAVWIAWRFNDAYTKAELRAYIKNFYEEFYDYTLSDAQITGILNGN